MLYAYLSRKTIRKRDAKMSRMLCCFKVTVDMQTIIKNMKEVSFTIWFSRTYTERERAIWALKVSSTWIEGHTFVGVSV